MKRAFGLSVLLLHFGNLQLPGLHARRIHRWIKLSVGNKHTQFMPRRCGFSLTAVCQSTAKNKLLGVAYFYAQCVSVLTVCYQRRNEMFLWPPLSTVAYFAGTFLETYGTISCIKFYSARISMAQSGIKISLFQWHLKEAENVLRFLLCLVLTCNSIMEKARSNRNEKPACCKIFARKPEDTWKALPLEGSWLGWGLQTFCIYLGSVSSKTWPDLSF